MGWRATSLNQVRNNGASPRVGATERGVQNGSICHTYVYHTILIPNVHQNGAIGMAMATTHTYTYIHTYIHTYIYIIYRET